MLDIRPQAEKTKSLLLCCYHCLKFRSCPHGFVCLGSIGGNPNYGFTSFDNLLWAMLTTFQLITLDYWENVYNMVVATGGPIHVIFFTIVVFFGSFYLINLMLAVVAMSYEEEAELMNAVSEKIIILIIQKVVKINKIYWSLSFCYCEWRGLVWLGPGLAPFTLQNSKKHLDSSKTEFATNRIT